MNQIAIYKDGQPFMLAQGEEGFLTANLIHLATTSGGEIAWLTMAAPAPDVSGIPPYDASAVTVV